MLHAVGCTLYGADRELRVLIVGLGGGVLPLYLLDVTIHYAQCGSAVACVALSAADLVLSASLPARPPALRSECPSAYSSSYV